MPMVIRIVVALAAEARTVVATWAALAVEAQARMAVEAPRAGRAIGSRSLFLFLGHQNPVIRDGCV